MRILSFFISILFMIQTASANEATSHGLKAIFDDLHYSVTVEWDQKDAEFLKKSKIRFQKELEELKKQGLSNEEIITFATSQFKDKKTQSDFTNLMHSFQVSNLSPNEMNKMLNDIIQNSYHSGASWIEDLSPAGKVAYFFALTVISGFIVYAMIYGTFEGVSVESGYHCSDVYVCDTYYDDYGSYESCGYQCI